MEGAYIVFIFFTEGEINMTVSFFVEGETDMVISFTGIIIVGILIYNFCYKESNKKYEEYFEEMYDDWEDYYE